MPISLQNARRELAYSFSQLDVFKTGVQFEPPHGDYFGETDHEDKRRVIVSSDLASLGPTSTEAEDDPDLYMGGWTYFPKIPLMRRIAISDGYLANEDAAYWTDLIGDEGEERVGVLWLAQQFTEAPPPGTEFELHHGKIPPESADGMRGLNQIINMSLKGMYAEGATTLSVTMTAGKTWYDLSAFPWITDPDQLLRVYRPNTNAAMGADVDTAGGSIVVSGGSRRLKINRAYNTGDVITVAVARPASTIILRAGVWIDSTAGLVQEDDQADVNEIDLMLIAKYHAYQALEEIETDEKTKAGYRAARIDAEQHARVAARKKPVLDNGDDGSKRKLDRLSFSGRRRRSWP